MRRWCCIMVLAFILDGTVLGAAEKARKQPIFVGARACAACHDGAGMGHQGSLWMLSNHAKAYAVLAKPQSKEIARLSGIPQEPQASPLCLGCHRE